MSGDRLAKIVQTQDYLRELGLDLSLLRQEGKAVLDTSLKRAMQTETQAVSHRKTTREERFQLQLAWGIFKTVPEEALRTLLGHDLPFQEEELFARIVVLLDSPESQAQAITFKELRENYTETGFRPAPLELPHPEYR